MNDKINGDLNSITETRFFSLFKIFSESPWPFYDAQLTWTSNKWIVNETNNDDVPDDWRNTNFTFSLQNSKIININNKRKLQNQEDPNKAWGNEFKWILTADNENEGLFYNLHDNSEAFTGYNGTIVWNQIYFENIEKLKIPSFPFEEKILYKLISGIHTNINIHISQFYSLPTSDSFYKNYSMYYNRVGFSKERIENLYFAYHFVVSALYKIKENLQNFNYSKFNNTENNLIQSKINSLFENLSKSSFINVDEEKLFSNISPNEFAKGLQPTFFNITLLINWVTCTKWKLHGLLQFHGMSAFMKIMFPVESQKEFTRDELVGFMNLIRKLSNSIKWYNSWIDYEDNELYFRSCSFYIIFPIVVILYFTVLYLLSGSKSNSGNNQRNKRF